MKKIFLLMTCLLAWGTSFAQKKGTISGKVVVDNNEALPYSLVKLINLTDTLNAKEVSANFDGIFQFQGVLEGQYQIKVKMVGYQNHTSPKITFSGGDMQLPAIQMQSTSKQLKEVSIAAGAEYWYNQQFAQEYQVLVQLNSFHLLEH